ncbi:hypothetical protein, partial [Pradoshia sp.]|uniref:hypothetical protein n=1 Tax=Pradoshia sp. TaxID=2651281 RepID=UPI003F0F9741
FSLMVLLFLIGNIPGANAAPIGGADSYQLLDNDHGAKGSSKNAMEGTWTYGNYGNDYKGDHRIAKNSGSAYEWRFTKDSGKRQYYAYLRHPDFVNPSASYLVWTHSLTDKLSWSNSVGSINQNTAYPGWNKIGSKKAYDSDTRFFQVMIINGSYKTGADGAEVDFYK